MLKEPGTADLTADVNYGVIQKVVSAVGKCGRGGGEGDGRW